MSRQLKQEIADRFGQAIEALKISKAQAAKDLGVSRQMLYQYLRAESTPNSKILQRACQKWNITLTHRGVQFGESAFPRPSLGPTKVNNAVQLSLFGAIGALADEDVNVVVLRKSRSAVDLRVRIKFAS